MVMNMPDEELAHEKTHLSNTVEAIDNRMGQIRESMPAEAAHQETAELLQEGHVAELSHLKRMRPRPYHGRIDFEVSEGTRVVRYLGEYQFGDVSSWTSPIAELFYRPASGKYFVEGQERTARVTLKRVFDIQEAALQSVSDVLRLAPPRELASLPEGASKDGYGEIDILDDPVLAHALEETGQTEKHEIVATIQPEQYQYIAETEASVMVVQGAAGSGKSLIGFHRLAFLLSEFNRLTVRPRADRVIMLGPSLAFWAQAKNLLPSLGWSNIAQTTLREWMISNFTQRPRLESDDRLLRDLMSNQSKLTQQDLEAERFKGSWGMKTAIDDYLARRKRQIYRSLATNLAKTAFKTADGQQRTLDSSTLRRLIPNDDSPLNSARDTFITALRRILGFSGTPRGRVQLNLFASEADNELDELVSREWPRLRLEEEYVKVVDGTERLAARKIEPGARLSETDIAPLLYMDHLLNQHRSHGYEHIIIDEAQDISPLEVHLLNLHSRNSWFTILGDLRQRVAKYRGMESWTELRRVFPHDNVEPFVVQNSYRSTALIGECQSHVCATAATSAPRNGVSYFPRPSRSWAMTARLVQRFRPDGNS